MTSSWFIFNQENYSEEVAASMWTFEFSLYMYHLGQSFHSTSLCIHSKWSATPTSPCQSQQWNETGFGDLHPVFTSSVCILQTIYGLLSSADGWGNKFLHRCHTKFPTWIQGLLWIRLDCTEMDENCTIQHPVLGVICSCNLSGAMDGALCEQVNYSFLWQWRSSQHDQ